MSLTHYVIFACVVYLAIVLGRKSMKYDMRRRFASIEEQGQSLRTAEDVVNCILQLRESEEHLKNENKALTNSLNIAKAAVEKLERDYKTLLRQLGDKREECEIQQTNISNLRDKNKELGARINTCALKFGEWMSKLRNYVDDIRDNAFKFGIGLSEYNDDMYNAGKKLIYVTKLLNKSHLLTIGEVEVQKNGSVKYSEGSRSLGNYASKENWGWLNAINITEALELMNPRESRPIALVTDYRDYKELSKKFDEVNKTYANIIIKSDNMRAYTREIKSKLEKLVVIPYHHVSVYH